MAKDEAQYAPSNAQLDLEARLENENKSARVVSTAEIYEPPEDDEGREYAVEGNELDEYVGANPEYMTYANETEKPYASEGAEAEVTDQFVEAMQPTEFEEEEPEPEPQTTKKTASKSAASSSSDSSS